MRFLVPLFLALSAAASADCTSRILVRTGPPIYTAHLDHGVLYFSTFAHRTIERVDEATGQTSTVFTGEVNLTNWDIENGTIALPGGAANELIIVAPDGSRRVIAEASNIRGFYLQDGYLYWTNEDKQLRRAGVKGGAAETVAVDLPPAPYKIFQDRVVWFDSMGLWWRRLGGGVPLLLLPRSDISAIDQVDFDGILLSNRSP